MMLVYTIKGLCRTCYTCVRECPAKAIRIVGGQAEVIDERCIACGNCTKVCSQGAKVFLHTTDRVIKLLENNKNTAAMVAPSFPAEFQEFADYRIFIGMIKSLGFKHVLEVSFGADLVADRYKKLVEENKEYYISSDCPSIVNYIKHYHHDLVNKLAPIVSPVVAMSRVVHSKYGSDTKIVFIGPCVAKKAESVEIDEAITYMELRDLFDHFNIKPETTKPFDFDHPVGGRGAIFPVTRGLLQTANINDDAITGNIIAAEGRIDFQGALKEYEAGLLNFARKNQVNHQLISIRELADHSLESVIVPANIKVGISDKTTNPDAMLDNEQMTQVLTNLVKNAIDAMTNGGSIDMILENTLGDVLITVKDTGTGIKEQDKAKIFEPFFTTKGIGVGTGLGLATAYGIVKMHKGQITVESNTDPSKGPTGTSFKIILPRRKE